MQEQENYIEGLLGQLTLEEKIGMIHGAGLFRTEGVARLGIPPLFMSDGPMGVRAEFADHEWRNTGTTDDFVSYLPCNSAIASTWNQKLAEEAGAVLGEEARGRKKDVILAPGINIKRSPLCGRNFEYMSEDPRLIEELVVPLVKGIQKQDVAACVKHFAANSQETERLWVDTKVDEQTLEEIYLPGFKAAVEKGKIYSLMGAYNRLNGEHCCTSKSLLNEKLRKEWNFDGMIVSDWGGVHDTVEAANSALDIEMDVKYEFSEQHMAEPLRKKILAGEIKEELIDEKVRNILRLMLRLKMIGEKKGERKAGTYNTPEHREAILNVARESVILLKNEKKILPLNEKKVHKVAVIGGNAAAIHSNGGGSAEIKALYEISPLMGIKKLLGGNCEVFYAPGYVMPEKKPMDATNWQAESTDHDWGGEQKEAKVDEIKAAAYRNEAVALAKECDTVIFVGGLNHDYDVEGADRKDMKLPYGQDEVIAALLEEVPDSVVVLYAGSPVEMPWLKKAHAVVFSYYAGMEGGTAIAETLFGRVNPSGKLAETFIKTADQCPAHSIGTFGRKDVVEYKEGTQVGYRFYDKEETDINFCFGHGLSYSSFCYEDLVVKQQGDEISVTVTVKNDSDVDGKETVQLYVAANEGTHAGVHELKKFKKREIKAGESVQVTFTLGEMDFAHYDVEQRAFTVKSGTYEIQVGTSSREICLAKTISL